MKIYVKFGFKVNIEAFSTEYSIGVKLQLMLDQMSSRWYDMFMKVVVLTDSCLTKIILLKKTE